MKFESEPLKQWFLSEKRDLPWRETPSPYAVWVSEVMLQQTQVAVVVPYFLRWMERFPTIRHLAKASRDEVIKMWEGLGYYSRARNLHDGAQYVVEHYNGELPDTAEALGKIKGLGPYTIGAILSFAFHQKVPAVDGNVIRVLTRYYEITDDITKGKTLKAIWQAAQDLLPDSEPWIVNEALIELGATVCKRSPQCSECPLKSGCRAYSNGTAEELPYKSTKTQVEKLYRAVAVITHQDLFLVRRGKKGEIMSDLHEFPYFELSASELGRDAFHELAEEQLQLNLKYQYELPAVAHTFTRYRVQLLPAHFTCEEAIEVEDMEWIPLQRLRELAFSSGHRRLFALALSNN